MMNAEPQREHHWLQQLVGEWTYEAEAIGEPGKPPERCGGTERVRSLGGLWVIGESEGQMPGGAAATMIITLGYDPQRKRFTGTWVGSMMTNLWVYDGELDAQERTLTLEAEGPSMSGDGTMARYRDAIEVTGEHTRVLRSSVLGPDGTWTEFMTAHYRRAR